MMGRVRRSARQPPEEIRRDPLEDAPPGWVYNPSAWSQRVPIAVLATIGFGIAGWLALFQLGALPAIWEPFFGDGSRTILTSGVSRMLPVPDAALGAFGYLHFGGDDRPVDGRSPREPAASPPGARHRAIHLGRLLGAGAGCGGNSLAPPSASG